MREGRRKLRVERMAALTDGLVAIIITVMVLDLPLPKTPDWPGLSPLLPVFAAYVLSYVNVGLFWNNHHHMLALAEHLDGRVLWANLALLFFLSLMPFVIRWMGVAGFATLPVAAYGAVLAAASLSYRILEFALIDCNGGAAGALAQAMGRDAKGAVSLLGYVIACALAFFQPLVAIAIYLAIAGWWLVPDRRVERAA